MGGCGDGCFDAAADVYRLTTHIGCGSACIRFLQYTQMHGLGEKL